ncbi:MAG: hypothetical protein JW776_05270 [Candidatus Lokiarchaeota archaeon]|nr:hypothetical protein [Candidatus Lokiarchaeota archaeon]
MIEYQEFLCYSLENDGTHKEMDIGEDSIEDRLHPDDVLIFIKQDMRRMWIWKGPKAPVRKRFISSRVAAKIQEEIRKESGRHLKIVSVDAGDEPIEFLSTFNLESMEVTEKINDMVYIRNIERDRIKEEQIKQTIKDANIEGDYWSPLLEESDEEEPIHSSVRTSIAPSMKKSRSDDYSQSISITNEDRVNQDLDIIANILQSNPPKNMERVNIIIGHRLYAPSKKTSEVFGETIESETWDFVPNLSKDVIDFSTKQIRVYTDKTTGMIKATEIFRKIPEVTRKKSELSKTPIVKLETDQTDTKRRQLPNIPTSED